MCALNINYAFYNLVRVTKIARFMFFILQFSSLFYRKTRQPFFSLDILLSSITHLKGCSHDKIATVIYLLCTIGCMGLMVYSHWLGLEPELGQGPGRMSCMVLIRTFHTAPKQGQGRTPGTFSGPEEWVWYPFFRSWKCALWWILVFFPVPVQVQCERFLLKQYNPFFQVPVQCERFCIIPLPVPVPVPVLDQASVNTPLVPMSNRNIRPLRAVINLWQLFGCMGFNVSVHMVRL